MVKMSAEVLVRAHPAILERLPALKGTMPECFRSALASTDKTESFVDSGIFWNKVSLGSCVGVIVVGFAVFVFGFLFYFRCLREFFQKGSDFLRKGVAEFGECP